MTRQDAVEIYQLLAASAVGVWVDGGFCVDADSSDSSFVLSDGRRNVDVHVFAYDASGKNVYGIEYPFGSLTGSGEIDGVKVSCVAPEWMLRFKTAYEPTAKHIADVTALAQRFGLAIPDTHRR